VRFSVYQISRKGGREKNEDRMGYCYTRDSGLFALADGMGGHPEGDMAAQVALQSLHLSVPQPGIRQLGLHLQPPLHGQDDQARLPPGADEEPVFQVLTPTSRQYQPALVVDRIFELPPEHADLPPTYT